MADMKISLKNVRLAFPEIYKAKKFKDGEGDPRFSATFLLDDKKQIKRLIAAIKKLAKEKWEDEIPKSVMFNKGKCCAGEGNDLDKVYDGFKDMTYVRASNKSRPVLIDRSKEVVTEEDGIIYGGCYVNAVVSLWAQDNGYGKRINANLQAIQFAKAGDAFGGGAIDPNVVDEFEDLGDDEDDEDFDDEDFDLDDDDEELDFD